MLSVHFFSPTYFIAPTIDLTWFCKNDREVNLISIMSFDFLRDAELIVLTGVLAWQEDALKTWAGKNENKNRVQDIFLHRAKMNSLACHGKWDTSLENE